MAFLGQDWSLQALKDKGKGLLANPNQMLESPLFNMGMGILSENSKPFGGDPFSAAMQGMRSAKETKQDREDRERIEQLRKEIQKMIEQQMLRGMGGQQTPGGAWQSPLPPQGPGAPLGGGQGIMGLLK